MMNKVILIGRMGKDPDLKVFGEGRALANLRVITNQAWKDRQTGGFKERTDGHNVVVHQAEAAKRLAAVLKKGDLVQIEGSLENRQWTDQDGKIRWVTEVIVRGGGGTVKRLSARGDRYPGPNESAAPARPGQADTHDDHQVGDGTTEDSDAVHAEIDFFDDGFGDGFTNG